MLSWELRKLFSRQNFTTLSLNVTASTYGNVTGVRDPRTMQFGAKFIF